MAQQDFERMLTSVLASAGTYIGKPRDGVQEIQFYPPFTEEMPQLIDGKERRLVCFDATVAVDSLSVEYFGFGHAIVDALVQRIIAESADGASAVRWISPFVVPEVRSGWQFNWLLKESGTRSTQKVVPGVCWRRR